MNVFVYGTLKRGFKNHHFLKNEQFLGISFTKEIYPMYRENHGAFPYLLNKSDGYQIKGELFEVSEETLKQLDWLEGAPDFFFREDIIVLLNGKEIPAFCYFYVEDKEPFDQIPLPEFTR